MGSPSTAITGGTSPYIVATGESPYGMNTERRAVEGTGDGTDATAVNATTGNATAVDHAPPLAKMSHLARGGSSPPLIPYELVPPMLKAASSAVFEVDSHSS